MTGSPCKDCVDRHVSCHSHCEKYIAWRTEMDEHKELISKIKAEEGMANKRRNDAIRKRRKQYAKKR